MAFLTRLAIASLLSPDLAPMEEGTQPLVSANACLLVDRP